MPIPRAITIVLVLLTAPAVFAQGMFLAEGQSGIGLAGAIAGGEDFDAVQAQAGFSTRAVFDFGLGYTRTTLDDGSADDLRATEWAPYINLGLIRPSPTSGLGAELRASYSWGKITNDNVFYRDIETTVITIGGAFYTILGASDSFSVQPDFAIYYAALSAKPAGASSSATDSEIIFGITLHGVIGRPSGTRVVLSPGFQTADGDMVWSLGVGFVFPQKDRKKSGWGS